MRLFRTAGLAVTVAAMALAMAACGSDTSPSTALQPTGASPSPGGNGARTPTPTGTATAPGGGQVFGPGCSSLPTSGAGSLSSMAGQPVATAVASNPQLSTLANAIKTAGLTDTLNNAQNITVFAPTNDAFNKVGQSQLNALLANKQQLTQTLEYHVVPQRLSPDNLAGTHKTMEGQNLTVTGSGEDFTVNNTASVVCGNIQTRNATVYLIDSVLTPPSSGTPTPAAT
ncbi:fasciclin domain-containing protein [Asanoa sp. NPDC050611]|uniref:fasciclin domain-containing protein n=1 Tax=Asanoa sp. NPDC050611 TaxID=3157098 RepID=UPI0033D6C16D